MKLDHIVTRNSGATLWPTVYKYGPGCRAQGLKMQHYGTVFAPVMHVTDNGYYMPMLTEPSPECLAPALRRLADLWVTPSEHVHQVFRNDRAAHHTEQVKPITLEFPLLTKVLQNWYDRTYELKGTPVSVVHGDPTLENYMQFGVWLDPSTRSMPLEAEFDAGKLLQSYFGYSGPLSWSHSRRVLLFIREQQLNVELCVYYLVTHIVRLYKVQPQARSWAVDTLINLDDRIGELCR